MELHSKSEGEYRELYLVVLALALAFVLCQQGRFEMFFEQIARAFSLL